MISSSATEHYHEGIKLNRNDCHIEINNVELNIQFLLQYFPSNLRKCKQNHQVYLECTVDMKHLGRLTKCVTEV